MTDKRVQNLELIGFQWCIMKRSRNTSAMQPPSAANDALQSAESNRHIFWFLNYVQCLFVIDIFIIYFIIYHISYGSSWLVHICDKNNNR